jgi:hypothetical protein
MENKIREMDLTTAQNNFAIRLYEWSQRDFIRELEEGCPLLSTLGLNNRDMAAFVAWNETLSSKERRSLAIALTRRCHENAARIKGEVLTEEDKAWHRASYRETRVHLERLPPLPTAERLDPEFRAVDPDHCLDALMGCLSPIMGKASRRHSKVLCTLHLRDWKIITDFTFLRRDQFLNFEYQFIRKDGAPIKTGHPAQGPFPRTMLAFYGLYHSLVRVPSEKDSEPMARVMARLAEYFVARAAPLFEGLGVDD